MSIDVYLYKICASRKKVFNKVFHIVIYTDFAKTMVDMADKMVALGTVSKEPAAAQ